MMNRLTRKRRFAGLSHGTTRARCPSRMLNLNEARKSRKDEADELRAFSERNAALQPEACLRGLRPSRLKTGARGLRSIVEGILLDTMFDLPDMEDVTEIVIDQDVVEGKKDPIRVHGGEAKEEAA